MDTPFPSFCLVGKKTCFSKLLPLLDFQLMYVFSNSNSEELVSKEPWQKNLNEAPQKSISRCLILSDAKVFVMMAMKQVNLSW
mmetsp:Transcript_9126/g.11246  ORF Transcript_9126/g.11246 Transcript_9126/m.11246 type:complete len:83 (-) Transcript_9126:60-308(-)